MYSPRQLRLLPGAGEAVRALNEAGVLVLVVTNQRGVALGRMSLSDVHDVHGALAARLRRFGAKVDEFYICPHADESCGCRKPGPGLFFQATRDYPGARPHAFGHDRGPRKRRRGWYSCRRPGHQIGAGRYANRGPPGVPRPFVSRRRPYWFDARTVRRSKEKTHCRRWLPEPTVPSFGEVNSRPYLIRMTLPWVN